MSKELLPYCENELIKELKNEIDSRNTEKYEVAYRKAIILQKELKTNKAHFNNFEKDSTYLKEVVPETIAFLEQNPDKTHCETLIDNFTEAYNWRLANCWLENLLKQDDIPALSTRIKQIETEILETIKDLAVYYSWSNCFARLTDTYCKHMEAWRQSIKKIGKGTWKHANKHRMDAKYHLGFCKDAIPAWVMPLYRVFETITPESKMFDVVIVDEASQCGFEGIPLYYLAKKYWL